jgi:16S rRNA (cytosine1402-N4)-methyltransferase
MTDEQASHIPVLMEQVLTLLDPKPGEVYADGTAGLGGHAVAVAERIGPKGVVVLNDLDRSNLAKAADSVRSKSDCRVVEIHGSFADMPRRLESEGLSADILLTDLGFASNQVDDPARGLTFRDDGPLDMRLDQTGEVTAGEMVNGLPEVDLANLIFQYGEERMSRRIAKAIVTRRKERKFETTGDLADVVRRSAGPPPKGRKRIDRATRTFQALRIAVNGEIESLDSLLEQVRSASGKVALGGESWLTQGARVGVISFHSLEDRPVKRMFQGIEQAGNGRRLTRKPAIADEAEISQNPRSRSAKLRVLQLLAEKRPDAR